MAGRALGFNVLLESGACFWNLPVSALLYKKGEGPLFDLDELELWDCLDDKVCVEIIKFLQYKRCTVKMKSGIIMPATYVMTFDWWDGAWAQMPDEHKCYHLLKIDNGQMVLYPNNHIIWHDQTIVTGSGKPDYKVNQQLYSSENSGEKKVVEDTDNMFYGLSDAEAAEKFIMEMRKAPFTMRTSSEEIKHYFAEKNAKEMEYKYNEVSIDDLKNHFFRSLKEKSLKRKLEKRVDESISKRDLRHSARGSHQHADKSQGDGEKVRKGNSSNRLRSKNKVAKRRK
jgi:hypothetical protein